MENRVFADRTGIVTSTAVSVGMTVPPPQIARLTMSGNGARWGGGRFSGVDPSVWGRFAASP